MRTQPTEPNQTDSALLSGNHRSWLRDGNKLLLWDHHLRIDHHSLSRHHGCGRRSAALAARHRTACLTGHRAFHAIFLMMLLAMVERIQPSKRLEHLAFHVAIAGVGAAERNAASGGNEQDARQSGCHHSPTPSRKRGTIFGKHDFPPICARSLSVPEMRLFSLTLSPQSLSEGFPLNTSSRHDSRVSESTELGYFWLLDQSHRLIALN